jgi:hypothetical protein
MRSDPTALLLRRLLVTVALTLVDGRSDQVDGQLVRLVTFADLDISVGLTEAAFEETATALDHVRSQFALHGNRDEAVTESVALRAFAAERPAIPAGDQRASQVPVPHMSSQGLRQVALAADGLVVVLGSTWTSTNIE